MKSSSSTAQPQGRGRYTRWVTWLLALGLWGYALSDHPLYGGTPGFGPAQMAIVVLGLVLAVFTRLSLEWNKRALLAFMASLMVLFVAEVGLEVLLGHRYRPGFRYDERYIFTLVPDRYNSFRHNETNGGHSVISRTNKAGFRGEELAPRGDHTRVVVYGDSFIHALYSPLAETFAERLEGELESKLGGEVEVVNAGVSSYGPDQLSFKMEDELPTLKPDLVVLAIYAGNDYGDLLRNKMFRLDDDGRLRRNAFRLDPAVKASFDASNQESIVKRAVRDALRRFDKRVPFAGLQAEGKDRDLALVDWWLRDSVAEYKDYVLDGNNIVTVTHVDHYSADVSLLPNSESARYAVRLMEAVLRRVKRITDKAGVPLAFLFIPHPLDRVPNYGTGRVDRERFPDYAPTNLTDPLVGMAQRNHWPFLNLYDAYEGHDLQTLYYRDGDDHWNARGQAIAAKAMAGFLVDSGLLSGK